MADTKISELPAATILTGGEKLPAVQGGANVAVTPDQIVALGSKAVSIRTVTGSATVDASNHDGSLIVVNSASAATVTLADDLPAGSVVNILQRGAGAVTIAGQTDSLGLPTGKSAVIAGQWQVAMAIKVAAGQWAVSGALADA